jgi:hypothetical protein
MTSSGPPATTSTAPPGATLRVTFAYRGRDISLLASRRVAMIAPPPVTAAPLPGQSGYWFELRGAAGELLYHRALSNPICSDIEAFSDDSRQTMTRIPIAAPQGQFEVLVPDLPGAQTFLLFGTPDGAPAESAPSRELFRADVDELRKPRGGTSTPDPGSAPRGSGTP